MDLAPEKVLFTGARPHALKSATLPAIHAPRPRAVLPQPTPTTSYNLQHQPCNSNSKSKDASLLNPSKRPPLVDHPRPTAVFSVPRLSAETEVFHF